MFVQDFPLRPSSSNANNAFYNDLRSFIVALNAPSDVVSEFDRYEFAGAKVWHRRACNGARAYTSL